MPDFRPLGGFPFRRIGGKASRGGRTPCSVRALAGGADWPCRWFVLPWRRPGVGGPNRPMCAGESGKRRRGSPLRTSLRPPCLKRPGRLGISRQAEQVPCPIGPAPRHRGIAGEPRIDPRYDLHPRPVPVQLRYASLQPPQPRPPQCRWSTAATSKREDDGGGRHAAADGNGSRDSHLGNAFPARRATDRWLHR